MNYLFGLATGIIVGIAIGVISQTGAIAEDGEFQWTGVTYHCAETGH